MGCPSDRVQAGRFGACLMKEPELVAKCVAAMQRVVKVPVTVKTRLGVDDLDSYELLCRFVEVTNMSGCQTFIIHARKAWLNGLSPRENRSIPPLKYEWVYQLKRDYPQLEILINGGIKTLDEIEQHLQYVDGAMVGREAYSNPYLFATVDQRLFGDINHVRSERDLVLCYMDYVSQQLQQGVPLRSLIRYLVGLFKGAPGARLWRRYLSEHGGSNELGVKVLENALELLQQ